MLQTRILRIKRTAHTYTRISTRRVIPNEVLVGAAAAAHNVDEAVDSELVHEARELRRFDVVAAERVGQPGVRVADHVGARVARDRLDERTHLARPERAVQSDAVASTQATLTSTHSRHRHRNRNRHRTRNPTQVNM